MGGCEKCAAYCWNICMPCRLVLGVAGVLFSLLLVVSIAIHLVDQLQNSHCGYSCGFALPARTIKNPMGIAFDEASKVFPFDYVLLAVVILWMFISTLFAITQAGVYFFCFKLYDFRAGKTPHNGLIMAIWYVAFVVLAINIQLLSLAPNYAMFGHQFYLPGTPVKPPAHPTSSGTNHHHCVIGLQDPSTFNTHYNTATQKALYAAYPGTYLCVATRLYGFYANIMINMPIFGLIFFASQWLFLLSYLYGLMSVLFCKQDTLSAEDKARLEGKPQVESIFY